MLAARSAPCLAYVPRVACSPHAPPPAWQTCHAWHARRTLRPLPGLRATRGMLAARSAPCLAYVPRVACSPHAPPPAWQTCHAWHACRTLRPLPGKQATVHGMSVTQCFNLGLFKFRQLISEELEFLVVTHNHLIQSMENSLKLMRAGGMLMTKHISLPLQPYHVRFGTAPPPPPPQSGACATRGNHFARPLARRTCHTWHARRTLRPLPGSCATRGITPHSPRPALPLP